MPYIKPFRDLEPDCIAHYQLINPGECLCSNCRPKLPPQFRLTKVGNDDAVLIDNGDRPSGVLSIEEFFRRYSY